MAEADVRSIEALEDLRAALVQFRGAAQEVLHLAEQEARQTLEWLAERRADWQREVERRTEAARQAQGELARCRASGYRDPKTRRVYVPDCSAYEHALATAATRLREAQTGLVNVQRWQRAVEEAAAEYRRQAQRLSAMLEGDVPKATAFLSRKVADLRAYVAGGAAGGGGSTSVSHGAGAGGESGSPGGIAWNMAGEPDEAERLQDVFTRLGQTETGYALVESLRERGTRVRFGTPVAGAIAHYDPEENEIVIAEPLWGASTAVLAAHVAHEATHVQWDYVDSIDQEYHAFAAQAAVWAQLRESEADEQSDWVSWMISLGKAEAKRHIRRYYPNLPE